MSIYLHVPFCRRKCGYCDFTSAPAPAALVDEYIDALAGELDRLRGGMPRPAATLYVGGGTPSLLEPRHFTALFAAVERGGLIYGDAEVTVEANPESLTPALARHLRSLGANRLSLGVQSLRDPLLRRLGRGHGAAEALRAVELARAAGFENVGVDLIYGIPGQTRAEWEEDLGRVVSLGLPHLSLYSLGVEEGTPFGLERAAGTLQLPPEEDVLAMYEEARARTAAAGYEHYEVSNFALPGMRSRHNTLGWTMHDCFGRGAGAHSFAAGPPTVRTARVPDAAAYVRRLRDGRNPVASREVIDDRQLAGETLMLGLRLAEGIDLTAFTTRFGARPESLFPDAAAAADGRGWMEELDGRLRLTPRGRLFSDEIFVHLFLMGSDGVKS